jgi:hypothetical protein
VCSFSSAIHQVKREGRETFSNSELQARAHKSRKKLGFLTSLLNYFKRMKNKFSFQLLTTTTIIFACLLQKMSASGFYTVPFIRS